MSLTGMSRTMTAAEVRRSFLEFFQSKAHEACASSSLIPGNDPTLMFANAGMVQFKDVFTGKETRSYKRATSSQKCIRISGKHNDLENVGVTARHHTFFEMLGNFSFGDYFKEDAIAWAWELLTKVWGLPENRFILTVFGGADGIDADDEARAIWRKVTGFGDERIVGIPGIPGDNFWQMGDTGPCGPCTELHFYLGALEDGASAPYHTFGEEPLPDGRGWFEIWNLVFMQFDRQKEGDGFRMDKLPAPSVDTGMGLERVTSVIQGKTTNYDTDLLRVLVDKAAQISGKTYGGSQADDDVSMRVIADHARTTAFLIAEGVVPDRGDRPYVLRRVMRRAIRHGHRLGINRPFLHEVALEVVALMGDVYPELVNRKDMIASVTEQEEIRFRETLDRGLKVLDEEVANVRGRGATEIAGAMVFKLSDTYGFPKDLTEVIARERGLTIDEQGFDKALEEAKLRSQGSKVGEEAVADVWRATLTKVQTTAPSGVRFTGYEREDGAAKVLAIAKGGALVDAAEQGETVDVVLDVTPFYGESGGQVGDHGVLIWDNHGKLHVTDTQKPLAGLVTHHGEITTGVLRVGDSVKAEVDHARRTATRRNHSATHLLHWALRTVLGEQATQKGSLVGPDRLRFDFLHGKPLTAHEVSLIEDLVNDKILQNAPVQTEVMSQEDAKSKGAMAIFEEKYGDVVRVLTMTKDSVELCGGTHARALGEIGLFKIVSEGGVSAGVRRIEAATGKNALGYVRHLEGTLDAAAEIAKSSKGELKEKLEKILERDKALEKEIAELKRKLAFGEGGGGGGGLEAQLAAARDIPGGKALAVRIDVGDAATLRELAEKLRDKLGESVVLVGAAAGDKAMLVVAVSKGLTDRYKAGDLIRPIAEVVGGKGGGRPDMAQAGGPDVAKLDEALASFYAKLA